MINELGRGLGYSVLLEVATGPDAYEGSASHSLDNGVRFVDWAHADRQIDPVFHHISYGIRKNKIYLKAGIE
jgi:hypothetical protein